VNESTFAGDRVYGSLLALLMSLSLGTNEPWLQSRAVQFCAQPNSSMPMTRLLSASRAQVLEGWYLSKISCLRFASF
jgi:hypothetical protein